MAVPRGSRKARRSWTGPPTSRRPSPCLAAGPTESPLLISPRKQRSHPHGLLRPERRNQCIEPGKPGSEPRTPSNLLETPGFALDTRANGWSCRGSKPGMRRRRLEVRSSRRGVPSEQLEVPRSKLGTSTEQLDTSSLELGHWTKRPVATGSKLDTRDSKPAPWVGPMNRPRRITEPSDCPPPAKQGPARRNASACNQRIAHCANRPTHARTKPIRYTSFNPCPSPVLSSHRLCPWPPWVGRDITIAGGSCQQACRRRQSARCVECWPGRGCGRSRVIRRRRHVRANDH